RGDLDWIAMRALEKNRARRYETATGLAMDIQRHLDNEPVLARPPNNFYRFQKLVRRHTVLVGSTAAVVLALSVGLIINSIETHRARRAERVAETEAVRSQQVATFLAEMLDGVGPSVSRGRDTTILKEILDKTRERIDLTLSNQPLVAAEL